MDIFKQGKSISVSWFYFKNIGDQVQGTYTGRTPKPVKDNFGNDQIVFFLQTPEGITNVGFKPYSRAVKSMEFVRPGQIVGFKFTGRDTSFNKKLGKDITYKVIAVYADPKLIDAEWIANHPDGLGDVAIAEGSSPAEDDDDEGTPAGFGNFDNPVPAENPIDSVKSLPVEEVLRQIAEIAKNKLGAIEATQVKEKVMAATGLAFLPVNYMKILEILKTL